tara:strand:- start:2502 stop:2780 length:279 start_codon:yes stop_codon:yes gene_type:complete
MQEIIQKSIDELNKVLPKNKKIKNEDSFKLVNKKSNLDSIDIVNLFIILEKYLKIEKDFILTFDDLMKDIHQLKTIGGLKSYLQKKLETNEG